MSELEHGVNCACRTARECENAQYWDRARNRSHRDNVIAVCLAILTLAGLALFL